MKFNIRLLKYENCFNLNECFKNQIMCICLNINLNPVRDYRLVENRCHKASHAVRYATRILQYWCIPYGMQEYMVTIFYRAIHSYGMFNKRKPKFEHAEMEI